MRLTTEQHEAMKAAVTVLTELIYSEEAHVVERMYLSDLRVKVEAVRLMPYGDDK